MKGEVAARERRKRREGLVRYKESALLPSFSFSFTPKHFSQASLLPIKIRGEKENCPSTWGLLNHGYGFICHKAVHSVGHLASKLLETSRGLGTGVVPPRHAIAASSAREGEKVSNACGFGKEYVAKVLKTWL